MTVVNCDASHRWVVCLPVWPWWLLIVTIYMPLAKDLERIIEHMCALDAGTMPRTHRMLPNLFSPLKTPCRSKRTSSDWHAMAVLGKFESGHDDLFCRYVGVSDVHTLRVVWMTFAC